MGHARVDALLKPELTVKGMALLNADTYKAVGNLWPLVCGKARTGRAKSGS
jgi:hypothetical protein